MPHDSILVPLDGSAFAEQALPLAQAIAHRARARLRLALVHQPPASVPRKQLVHLEVGLRRAERDYLKRIAGRLTPGTQVTSVILTGKPGPALARYAEDSRARLVTMSTHGRGGLERAWLGSVADYLLRELSIPLLLVRPREGERLAERPPAIERILVALDGSDAAETVLGPAGELARLFDAELLLRRVVQPIPLPADPLLPITAGYDADLTAQLRDESERYLRDVAERLGREGLRASGAALVAHAIARCLLETAEREGVGLIALTTRARGGVRRLGLGSVADKVARGAACPVLLYRPRRAAGRATQQDSSSRVHAGFTSRPLR